MKDLSVGKESKLILQFAMPMLLGNVFQQLYNIVDSIIIGRYIGKQALAAVGASFPILFIIISMVIGFVMGVTIIVSQYFGAKETEKVKRTIDTFYIVIFFAALLFSITGIFFSDDIFRVINLPGDVLPYASIYLKIYLSGMVFFFGFNGTSAILRGLGDSKTPLYFLIMSTFANIGLDVLFVVVFKLGIEGVAVATIIAQASAFIAAILYLNKYHKVVKLSLKRMVFDKDIFLKSIKIGLPSGIQQSIVAFGLMALIWIVNHFGTDVIAAYSIAMRIDSLASMAAMNFASALATFAGQNLGAGKPERVKTGLLATLKMTTIISISISVIAILFSEQLMRVFTVDENVIAIGAKYLKIVGSFYILFSTLFVTNGVMRGAGDTLVPMFITLLALWGVRIPAAYFLSLKFGADGIWWATPMGWFVGMTLSVSYYLTGKWKKKVIVQHKQNIR